MTELDKIIKIAEVLRKSLQRGRINIPELDSFLGQVESYAPPAPGKRKREDGMIKYLDKIGNKKANR